MIAARVTTAPLPPKIDLFRGETAVKQTAQVAAVYGLYSSRNPTWSTFGVSLSQVINQQQNMGLGQDLVVCACTVSIR